MLERQRESKSRAHFEGDKISAYFISEFGEQILRICKEFPLWTNVMRPFFNSQYETATSAYVEGNFSELKKQNITNIHTNVCRPFRFDALD